MMALHQVQHQTQYVRHFNVVSKSFFHKCMKKSSASLFCSVLAGPKDNPKNLRRSEKIQKTFVEGGVDTQTLAIIVFQIVDKS